MMGNVWEATLQLPDKREEAYHNTRQTRTNTHSHTRTPSSSAARFPRPPINPLLAGSPLLLLLLLPNPPNSPAKLTAPIRGK